MLWSRAEKACPRGIRTSLLALLASRNDAAFRSYGREAAATLADLSAAPQLTPELIRNFIDAQIGQLRALDYEADLCLIDLGATAEQVAAAALTAKRFDCIVIGAGLRQPPAQLLLFEKVVNLVHALAPAAKICFNTNPADTVQAVRRWIEP